MIKLKTKCDCLTYEAALKIKEHLEESAKIHAMIDDNTANVKNLKRKLNHLEKAVEQVLTGRCLEEQRKEEYRQTLIEFVKKREINVEPANKKIKTVPWTKK